MSTLVIIAASYQHAAADDARSALADIFGLGSAFAPERAIVLHPLKIDVDGARFERTIPYDTAIGLERNQELWRPLRDRAFDDIVILGSEPHLDFEEIVLGCYLEGHKKTYLGRNGLRDLAEWQVYVKPDLTPREVRFWRVGPEKQREYLQTVHRWLADRLTEADFNAPTASGTRSPEALIYLMPSLAVELAQQAINLQTQAYGLPFSILMCDGSMGHSSDFYRSLANFVMAIDGIESVLDVGCGNGFLACHLAASGRYKTVLGTDASTYRIDGARLHGALNNSSARFELMSMAKLPLADRSVDLSVTSFALEQAGDQLDRCFAEIRRVTRKRIILFEPSTEFFPTLPSLWHVPSWGWANQYHAMLVRSGLSFAVRPILLYHYYNPGAVFVIDLESQDHPCLSHPQLFGLRAEDWPGGVKFI